MNEWMDGWTDGWMDGWMDGRMDGWTDDALVVLDPASVRFTVLSKEFPHVLSRVAAVLELRERVACPGGPCVAIATFKLRDGATGIEGYFQPSTTGEALPRLGGCEP